MTHMFQMLCGTTSYTIWDGTWHYGIQLPLASCGAARLEAQYRQLLGEIKVEGAVVNPDSAAWRQHFWHFTFLLVYRMLSTCIQFLSKNRAKWTKSKLRRTTNIRCHEKKNYRFRWRSSEDMINPQSHQQLRQLLFGGQKEREGDRWHRWSKNGTLNSQELWSKKWDPKKQWHCSRYSSLIKKSKDWMIKPICFFGMSFFSHSSTDHIFSAQVVGGRTVWMKPSWTHLTEGVLVLWSKLWGAHVYIVDMWIHVVYVHSSIIYVLLL